MNRGSRFGSRRRRRIRPTSMRPRFMNRGSRHSQVHNRILVPYFNEAPIHESGKSLPTVGVARMATATSMRPRFMNRGSVPRRGRVTRLRPTSMRPRFMNRGSTISPICAAPVHPHFNEAPIHESGKSPRPRSPHTPGRTSMRPRFMNRGSDVGEPGQPELFALQ